MESVAPTVEPQNAPAQFVRTMEGRITLWSPAMEERYGFTGQEADGRISHELLGTVFWQAKRQIDLTLIEKKEWSGGLIHYRMDGRAVMSGNHWHLDQDTDGHEMLVTETHLDIVPPDAASGGDLGDAMTAIAHEFTEPLQAISSYIAACQIGLKSAWPDLARQREALTLAADQVVRTAKTLRLLRVLGTALRDGR